MRIPHFNLCLRTKFLLALVLTVAALSCATLLVVRHTAEKHLQQEIATEAQNSRSTFEAILYEREVALSHKANLLATVAAVSDSDDPTLADTTDNPLEMEGSDLVVLADGDNKVTALHATNPRFTTAAAEQMLSRSLSSGNISDWWYIGGALYQVVVLPVDRRPVAERTSSGTVVVGQEIGYSAVHELGKMSSSQLAFSYGGEIAASTLTPLNEVELGQKVKHLPASGHTWIGGEEFYVISVPLTDPASHTQASPAHLIVLKSYSEAAAFLNEINRLLAGLGAMAFLAGIWISLFISDTFTRPLAKLDEGVQALAKGDFTFPLSTEGGDEVARVTRAFDHMRSTLQTNETQKRKLEDELRQAQKMEALGRLAGGVAHDFNNLLTVIKGHSELIVDRLPGGDPMLGSGQQIKKAADRAAALTRQMLAFSRRQTLEPTVFDMNTLVVDMCKLLKRLIHEDIEFSFRGAECLGRVKADTGQIEQVLLNLTVNACDAMPKGGTLVIETQNITVDEHSASTCPTINAGQYVMLAVSDTGQGMDPETKERIFEPFFTTKEAGKGTGLGLATVYGVVKQSNGFIRVETAPGKGSRFEVYLPRVEENVQAAKAEVLSPARAKKGQTVLLAEDEEAVRLLACEFLTGAGYRVFAAEDGEQALEIAATLLEPIDLLVTDVVMPKMRGPDLARRLKCLRPELKVLYMSGYLEQNDNGDDAIEDIDYLQKPFSRDLLIHRAGEALRNEPITPPAAPAEVKAPSKVSEARATQLA